MTSPLSEDPLEWLDESAAAKITHAARFLAASAGFMTRGCVDAML
jgi:hypothetical protein